MRSISCTWPLQSGWVGGTNTSAPPRVELTSPNASSAPILRVELTSPLAVVAAAGGGVGAAAGGAADLGAAEVGAVEVGAVASRRAECPTPPRRRRRSRRCRHDAEAASHSDE